MKASNPLLLFPVPTGNIDLQSPPDPLSSQQKELLKLIDGRTSIAGLALLLGYPLERCQEDIQLFEQKKYVTLSQHSVDHKRRYCRPTPGEQKAGPQKATVTASPRKRREERSSSNPIKRKRASEPTPSHSVKPKKKPELAESLFSVPSGLQDQIASAQSKADGTDPFMPSMKGKLQALQTQKNPAPDFAQDLSKTLPSFAVPTRAQHSEDNSQKFKTLTDTKAFPELKRDATLPSIPVKAEFSQLSRTQTEPTFKREKTLPDLAPVPPYPSKRFTTLRLTMDDLEKLVRKQEDMKTSQKSSRPKPEKEVAPSPIQSAQTEENEALIPEKLRHNLKDTSEDREFSFSMGANSNPNGLIIDLTSPKRVEEPTPHSRQSQRQKIREKARTYTSQIKAHNPSRASQKAKKHTSTTPPPFPSPHPTPKP